MTATDKTGKRAPGQLAARYGRTPSRARRDRIIALVAAIVGAVIIVAWVVWAGLDQAGSSIDSQDTGHRIVDAQTVEVSYRVSAAVGSTAACALQVQNEAHAIVGWRVVHLAPSTRYTTAYTDTVRSSERGVTGLIYTCWLT